MSDVIGRGIIEVSGDSSKLNAAIADARRSIASLGEANKQASEKSAASIDRYIKKLETQQKTSSMTTREAELYKLALRGASDEQLRAANSILRLNEANQRGVEIGSRLRAGFLAVGAAAATALAGGMVAFDRLIKQAGDFQDMAEKTGDTAENFASLAVAAGTAGVQMDAVVGASVKLTKNLTGVDDESKAAGAAIAALGLNMQAFKNLRPADQLEALAKAFDGFEDGPEKTATAIALLGKSGAEMLPFLKALAEEGGRQNILTAEQIRLADEYSDAQGKMRAALGLHAQAIATEALPAMKEFGTFVASLAKDQEFAATASDLLKGAMSGAITVFQTIAVVASDVGFVFKGVGREIGAIAAQLVMLSTGNLEGFHAISDAVKADAEKARQELDRFQARVMSLGQTGNLYDPANYGNEGRSRPGATANKPKLGFSGAIKKDGKADVYTDLLTPAAKEYAAALEKIANAEIAADAATRSLNGAQSALYELMRSPEWEQMPETWREAAVAQAALSSSAIEAAAAEKRLSDMIAATPTEKIKEARRDMELLTEALEAGRISEEQYLEAVSERLDLNADAIKEQKGLAEELGLTFTSAFEDAVIGGKKLSDVLQGLAQDIARVMLRKSVTEPFLEAAKGFDLGKLISSIFTHAKGGAYASPSLSAYSNGVYGPGQQKFFAFANGGAIGTFAEPGAGYEAIMPLRRGADGKLGVQGGGGGGVAVYIVEAPGKGGQLERRQENGQDILTVFVDRVRSAIAGDIARGDGAVPAALNNTYGLNRVAGAY